MSTNLDRVAKEIRELRNEIGRVSNRSPFTFGTIDSVDYDTNLVTVTIAGEQEVVSGEALALAGTFPEVDQIVLIARNGRDHVIIAPPGPMVSTPPAQVTGVVATPGILSVLVTWNEVADVDVIHNRGWYQVQFDDNSGFTSPLSVLSATNEVVIADLATDVPYWFRVRAIDSSGTPSASWSTSATTSPTFITETEIADDSISTPKLQANAVVAGKILAGAITTAKLDANAVTAAKLAAIELEVSKYIRSTTFSSGSAGWAIEADGTAEFNDVIVRGTIEASDIYANTLSGAGANLLTNGGGETVDAVSLVTNPDFDSSASNWTGTNCTLARRTSSPSPYAGAGYLGVTSTAGGTMSILSDEFVVQPGVNYTASIPYRTAVTGRVLTATLELYNSAHGFVSSQTLGYSGTDGSGAWAIASISGQPAQVSVLAAYGRVKISWASTSAAEVHYVDSVTILRIVPGWGNTSSSNGSLTSVTSPVRTGSRAVSYAASGSASPSAIERMNTEWFAAVGGAAYEFDGYIRASSGTANVSLSVSWKDSGGSDVSTEYGKYLFALSTTYRNAKFVVKAPATAAYGLFYIGVASASNGVIADDYTVKRVNSYDGGYVSAGYLESKTDVVDATGLVMPVGCVLPFAGTISGTTGSTDVWASGGVGGSGDATGIAGVPPGWVPCDARAISRTTYWRLFSVIGTTYGTGDGSTTFNVPDLRGRVPVCLDNMGGSDAGRLAAANTLGTGAGAETHTLTTSEIPTVSSHYHTPNAVANFWIDGGAGGNTVAVQGSVGFGTFYLNTVDRTNSAGGFGSGGSHNNMQPYILLNYIIKC